MSRIVRLFGLWLGALSLATPALATTHTFFDDVEYAFQLGGATAFRKGLISAQDHLINGEPLLYLAFDLQYKNFFITSSNPRYGSHISAGTLGYRLWQTDHSDLAIVGYSPHDSIDPEAETLFDDGPIEALEGLRTRRADMMWGLRYQYWQDAHFFAGEVAQDSDAHSSQHVRFIYSYRQQVKNWDLYYNTSVMFTPAKLVNYYYGVRPDESRDFRPAYQAGGGAQLTLSVTGVYPLSQRWLFECSLGNTFYSSSYRNSPLVDHPTDLQVLVSARYVF